MLKTWMDYVRQLGPGFITGVAVDDPSGIATYYHGSCGRHAGGPFIHPGLLMMDCSNGLFSGLSPAHTR